MCPKEHLFRASIHKYMSLLFSFYLLSHQSLSTYVRKQQTPNILPFPVYLTRKKTCTQRVTTADTILLRAHTSKGAIYQISRHLISSFTSSGNMKNAEIFTYPSIHRFGCVAKVRGYGCAGYRILFSWGISSVFKSDRVLAINDDAVFLGGRAALII